MKIEKRNGYTRIEYSSVSYSDIINKSINDNIQEFKRKFNLTNEARVTSINSEVTLIRVETGGFGSAIGFRNDMYIKYNDNYYIVHYFYEKSICTSVIVFDETEPVNEEYVKRRIKTCNEGINFTQHFTCIGRIKYNTKTSYDFHYEVMSDREKELLK